MIVKFLKAGSGDCILIQDSEYNVLIDGGNDYAFLQGQLENIHNLGQKIDVLILSHHDDDHIAGILSLIKSISAGDFGGNFLKKVLSNTPRKIREELADGVDQALSYKQARELEELLYQTNCLWETVSDKSGPLVLGSLNLRFLSPTAKDLEKYGSAHGAYLTSDYRCDWDVPMSVLEPFISDESKDSSASNRTSVVVLLEAYDKKVLLTGDCVPDRLEEIVDGLIAETDSETLSLDYLKLPHHGSYRSLTKSLLSKIDCNKFIISTNSKRHFLPNKRAILKIIKFCKGAGETEFLFNYSEALLALKISPMERKKYAIRLTPNNQPYGISI